jgi:hypothetical protein
MKPVGEIDGFDASNFAFLSEWTVFGKRFAGKFLEAAFETPIRREDGDLVAQLREAFG